jgi:hypothetical protein
VARAGDPLLNLEHGARDGGVVAIPRDVEHVGCDWLELEQDVVLVVFGWFAGYFQRFRTIGTSTATT